MRFVHKKRILGLLLIVLFLVTIVSDAFASDNIVINGDFSHKINGWTTKKWIVSESIIETVDEILKIKHNDFNDTRISQEIFLDSETRYKVSADIKIDRIQSEYEEGSAWIGIKDSAARMNIYTVDAEWTRVEFYILNESNKNTYVLDLGFGDHGILVNGECEFANIVVEKDNSQDTEPLFALQNKKENDADSDSNIQAMLDISKVLSKILWAFLCFVFVYAILIWAKSKKGVFNRYNESYIAIVIISLALLLRCITILFSKGYPLDTKTFLSWGQRLAEVGPANFYSNEYFCDYPPGMISLISIGVQIVNFIGIPLNITGPSLLIVFLPILIADVAISYVIWKYARKRVSSSMALGILLVLAFHPVFIHNSAIWHQVDTVMTLLLVICFILLEKKKYYLAAFIYGIAVIMKPQALMFGPLFALPYLKPLFTKGQRIDGLLKLIASAIIAFATIIIISLPFKGNQPFWPFTNRADVAMASSFSQKLKAIVDNNWLIQKYYSTAAESYPYATVNGYNIYALLNANYVPESTKLGLFSYSTYANVAILVVVALTIVLYIYSQKNKIDSNYLLAAFLIFGLFMFGPRMHERYSFPVLAFLALAYVKNKDRGILNALAAISAGIFANVTMTLMVLNDMDMYFKSIFTMGVMIISAYNVLCFLYLSIIVYDVCVKGRIQKDPTVFKSLSQLVANDETSNYIDVSAKFTEDSEIEK